MNEREERYQAILRNIAARQGQVARAERQQVLESALDALDVLGKLDALCRHPPDSITCYGPQVFRGGDDTVWVAVLIWHKPKGYGQHERLGLFGVWALDSGAGVMLIAGSKTLTFKAPIFNAETYHYHIKRGFSLLYAGDASPPPSEGQQWQAEYDPARRLALRDELDAALRAYLAAGE
ncbi:MAG: hypothetical protein JNJ61_31145 [Anaerolineae bacterium]|nr:hypothetical protein [Anaerolineae bacterium]